MTKYIKRVSAVNFQGRTFSYDLSPLTAIIGKNMRGKTAVVNAIRLGLLKYSPAHGNKSNATFGFAGLAKIGTGVPYPTAKMGVELYLSDDILLEQTWEKKNGKIIQTGTAPAVPPVLLDIKNEYLSKSGPKQVEIVFDKLDLSKLGFTKNQITARLKKDCQIETPTEESEAAIGSICEDVAALDQERAEFSWTPQKWMDEIVETITAKRDGAKQTLAGMAGLIQGTAALAAQEGIRVPFDRQQLADARQKLAELLAEQQRVEKLVEGLRALQAERGRLEKALEGVKDHGEEIARTITTAGELEKEINAFKSMTNTVADVLTNISRRIATQTESLRGIKARMTELQVGLADDLELKCCPRCKSKGTEWKDSLVEDVTEQFRVLDAQAEESLAIVTDLNKHAEEWSAKLLACKEADAEQATRQSKLNACRKAIATLQAENMKHAENRQRLRLTVEQIEKFLEAMRPVKFLTSGDELTKWTAEVERLEQIERDCISENAKAAQAEEARQKHNLATAEYGICELALKSMKGIRAELMEKGFGSFMARVNRFTQGIMPGAVEYREGEFGYWAGATWVSMDHFSGTEEMLTAIGLAVALAQESPIRFCSCDEWLRDAECRLTVAGRLKALVEDGTLDQAIVIDVDAAGYAELGFQIVNV